MSTATKTIVIYTGRFQPFGPHHFAVYRRLCERFDPKNVFITTTNFVEPNKCPLSYSEKVQVIQKFGVPKNQICCVTSTYKSKELIDHFDSNTTSVIFVYGEKDAGRINYFKSDKSQSYFTPYRGQLELEPLKKIGYILIAPQVDIAVDGQEVNGTLLRNILPDADPSRFSEIMGWYDSVIHAMFKRRFKSNLDSVVEALVAPLSKGITKTQLLRVEQYADRLFKEFGIDIEFQDIFKGTHFFQRLNDPRNGTPITTDELRQLFKKVSSRYGDKLSNLSSNAEGVLKDMESDINMPFVIKYDTKNREIDLVPKTIMRKPDFKSNTPVYAVESVQKYTRHIMHPFEDENLTYGELIEMVRTLCDSPQDIASTLKIDGQNCKFTDVAGKVLAARNKSTALSPMTKQQLVDKFDLPELKLSFGKAFDEVERWLKANRVINSERTFLNVEICDPQTKNVIDNGIDFKIYVHGLIEYDENGNEVGKYPIPSATWTDIVQSTPKVNLIPIGNSTKYVNKIVQFADGELSDRIQNTDELQICIGQLGSEILRKISKGSTNDIIARLENIADEVIVSEPDIQLKYMKNIQRLMQLDGTRAIAPIEGIVFDWKNGNQYKLTGAFGPINQILGLLKYNR